MIELRHVSKTFAHLDVEVEALKDINLTINDGDVYGIIGMSGAGKSTLVRCINLLERPTEGEVFIDGVNMCALKPRELREKRREVTMIFQGFNLLMQRNCLDNICFPLELAGVPRQEAVAKAKELLQIVELPDKALAYPAQLSGGQQQRIAIARALATDPRVLLCDEATSALDPKTTHAILQLIKDINRRLGITVIIITHQMSVVEEVCNRVAILDQGAVAEEGEVSVVFANPKSDAAKRLVYPDSADVEPIAHPGETILRVVFNGSASASEPKIANMAIEEGIPANILYASTKTIGDMVYGNMLLGISGDEKTVERAVRYLKTRHTQIEIVKKEIANKINEEEQA